MEHNGVEEYHSAKSTGSLAESTVQVFWRRTALVMLPAETTPERLPEVRGVPSIAEPFTSENEAREMVLKLTREFIDNGIRIY